MKKNTFRYLDSKNNIDYLQGVEEWEKETTLVSWYIQVQDKEFKDFNIEDICRSIRQQYYIDRIFPYAIKELKKNINSGELYDGELLMALNKLPVEQWTIYSNYKTKIRMLLKEKLVFIEEEDILKGAQELLSKVSH